MPDNERKCTPLSVRVALRRSDTQKIEFSLTKGCRTDDDKSFYIIHFALLEKKDDKFEPKVSVDIDINKEAPDKEDSAEDTVNSGLTENQVRFIRGPVARAADKVTTRPDGAEALTFGDMDALLADTDEAENVGLNALDRAAAARRDNLQKLRDRVVSVLDIA